MFLLFFALTASPICAHESGEPLSAATAQGIDDAHAASRSIERDGELLAIQIAAGKRLDELKRGLEKRWEVKDPVVNELDLRTGEFHLEYTVSNEKVWDTYREILEPEPMCYHKRTSTWIEYSRRLVIKGNLAIGVRSQDFVRIGSPQPRSQVETGLNVCGIRVD